MTSELVREATREGRRVALLRCYDDPEEGATIVRVGQALFGERPHDHVGHHVVSGVR